MKACVGVANTGRVKTRTIMSHAGESRIEEKRSSLLMLGEYKLFAKLSK
jgi:hypothetical protein